MSKSLLTIVVVIFLIIGGALFLSKNKSDVTPTNNQPLNATQEQTSQGTNGETKVLAGTTTKLLDFTKEEYDKALSENKVILLYFYANWCPICRVEAPNELYPAFNELQEPNVVGFRINYNDDDTNDDEKALAKQFGITYQHTKVIIKEGKQVLKSMDSWKKAQYISEITKAAR